MLEDPIKIRRSNFVAALLLWAVSVHALGAERTGENSPATGNATLNRADRYETSAQRRTSPTGGAEAEGDQRASLCVLISWRTAGGR